MQVLVKLKVTPEEFFDVLIPSILEDIKESTGKSVKRKDIEGGYKYSKTMKNKLGKGGNVKVEITHFTYPEIYTVNFISAQGTTKLHYDVERLEDGCGVDYQETFESNSKLKSANHKVLEKFMYKKLNKRANTLLANIEKHIIANRSEITE